MGRYAIYMPPTLWLKFRAVCVLNRVSASKQIILLIQQFLEQQGKSS